MPARFALLPLIALFFSFVTSAQSYNVTEAEAKVMAQKLQTSINQTDPSVLSAAFYTPELLRRTWQKVEAPQAPAFKAGFADGFKTNDLAKQFISNIEKDSYRLLRVYQNNNTTHILFRSFGEGGLNYHDYILYKIKDSIKVVDMYTFLIGEEFSTTLAELVTDMSPKKAGKGEGKLSLEAMLQAKALKAKGEYAELKKLIEAQPPEFRTNKAIQTLYLNACQQLDEESYTKALENYSLTFPEASNAYLLMLDLYYTKKEVVKGLTAIDKIDSLVGGDALLDLYRGNFLMLEEKYAEANKFYEKVFSFDPTIYLGMVQLTYTYALQNEFDKAKAVVEKYKKTPGYKQSVIDELYANIPDLKN